MNHWLTTLERMNTYEERTSRQSSRTRRVFANSRGVEADTENHGIEQYIEVRLTDLGQKLLNYSTRMDK